MCFLGRGTHITRDMCFLCRGAHITRDMCFLCRGTHITRDMCLFPVNEKNTYAQVHFQFTFIFIFLRPHGLYSFLRIFIKRRLL